MAVQVVSVTASQTVDAAGNLTDTYDVAYTIDGKAGTFTVSVSQTGDPVKAAKDAIDAQEAQVSGIYAIS